MRERITDVDDLLDRIRQRDRPAVAELYDLLGARAYGLAYRIVGERAAAEDAVQEAFLTVWRQADRVDAARGRLSAYLMTIVHHKAIDIARARAGRVARQLPLDPELAVAASDDVAGEVIAAADADAVRRSLSSLPDVQRRVVEMAYLEGLTHVEIAGALDTPLGTVKSRLRLAIEKLRATLGVELREGPS